jgi:hypothetical protein
MELPWMNLVGESAMGDLATSLAADSEAQAATVTFLVDRDGTVVASILSPQDLEAQTTRFLTAGEPLQPTKPQ